MRLSLWLGESLCLEILSTILLVQVIKDIQPHLLSMFQDLQGNPIVARMVAPSPRHKPLCKAMLNRQEPKSKCVRRWTTGFLIVYPASTRQARLEAHVVTGGVGAIASEVVDRRWEWIGVVLPIG